MPLFCFRLFVLLAALAFAKPATAQDCALASTAECNGVPCPGETRPEGRIIYNTDYGVAQICQDGIWVALSPIGDFCPGAGLVGHWTLNESGNVSTAADSSAGGNDGTLTNFPADPSANWVAGKLGNALDFDGQDDYVDVDPLAGDLSQGDYTMSIWLKYTSTELDSPLVLRSGSSSADGEIGIIVVNFGGAGAATFRVNGTSVSSTVNTNDGAWHHIVGTRAGTTNTLYVDGVQKAQGTASSANAGTQRLVLGNNHTGPGEAVSDQWYTGSIDDPRIYNRALDAAEIAALYNGGAGCQ